MSGYCVHGKRSEHDVNGTGTTCIGPFTRRADDPAIIPSERPDEPKWTGR